MAAFVRHGGFKTSQLLSPKNVLPRCYATKAEKRKGVDRKVGPKIDSSAKSLAAKGFLRSQIEYSPPEDLEVKLNAISSKILGNSKDDEKISDLNQRFKLFTACNNEFKHSIPNSLLHSIETLGDVKKFYSTSVDVRTPLDKLQNMDLPENLHVQFEYHRFNPETDTFFNGQTAFNKSSTIVTGLKYKGKYGGHYQPGSIPDS
ncbi:unnamed protein product [Brassicogethes aeneus]|uniref:Large ribosomal subunit protein mL50 n=1 Tax=Brassicogethes aeneus TaxID=1431903 RepID=A0A9P0FN25_BRAAE|nr:unnamed protein product [Brassicogethes aeneus]